MQNKLILAPPTPPTRSCFNATCLSNDHGINKQNHNEPLWRNNVMNWYYYYICDFDIGWIWRGLWLFLYNSNVTYPNRRTVRVKNGYSSHCLRQPTTADRERKNIYAPCGTVCVYLKLHIIHPRSRTLEVPIITTSLADGKVHTTHALTGAQPSFVWNAIWTAPCKQARCDSLETVFRPSGNCARFRLEWKTTSPAYLRG